MKSKLSRFAVGMIGLCSFVSAQTNEKQLKESDLPDPANVDIAKKVQSEVRSRFLNLPEEKRTEFSFLMAEASRFLDERRIFECLDVLQKADQICPNFPDVGNLRGGCYMHLRQFDKAQQCFIEGLKAQPQNYNLRFNLAEAFFVDKKWAVARKLYSEIGDGIENKKNEDFYLIEFKIFICDLKLEKSEAVTAYANKYKPMDDTLAYAYAKATMLLAKDRDSSEAMELLLKADQIYNKPSYTTTWRDTLVEAGYLTALGIQNVLDQQIFTNPKPAPTPVPPK